MWFLGCHDRDLWLNSSVWCFVYRRLWRNGCDVCRTHHGCNQRFVALRTHVRCSPRTVKKKDFFQRRLESLTEDVRQCCCVSRLARGRLCRRCNRLEPSRGWRATRWFTSAECPEWMAPTPRRRWEIVNKCLGSDASEIARNGAAARSQFGEPLRLEKSGQFEV